VCNSNFSNVLHVKIDQNRGFFCGKLGVQNTPCTPGWLTHWLGQVGDIVGRHGMVIENNIRYLNKLLLEGDSILSEKDNIQIFRAVENYIEKSKQF
jgi:hypothetical protein